jgi:hypothetical protein
MWRHAGDGSAVARAEAATAAVQTCAVAIDCCYVSMRLALRYCDSDMCGDKLCMP